MGITERYFQLGTEHNVIHLPYRPNGFGIFILGTEPTLSDMIQAFGSSIMAEISF